MSICKLRLALPVALLGIALLLSSSASGQNPTPAPSPVVTPNPAQRDATRPPGSEQTPNPQAPPGSQQNPALAPPGTNVAPQSPTQVNPQQNQPSTAPRTQGQPTEQVPTADSIQEPREPVFPDVKQRPLPPLPNLTRLGVNSGAMVTLTLKDAIRRALENNNDIEVARDDVRFAETQLRSFEGVYDPVFLLTPQYDKRVTPQQSIFSGLTSAGTTSTTVYTLSPGVAKSFSLGGGDYQVSFSNTKTNTNSTSNIFNPVYASNLGVTFTQPLWRNRSMDSNRRSIRVQKKRIAQTDADFRQRTIDVISQVQSAYWDLVFTLRDQQIQLANLNLARENLRQVEAQIAAGVKAPLERAEVLTELANRESNLLTATQTVSIAENVLKQLILKDTTAPEWFAPLTPTDSPVFDSNPVNLNDAIAEARKNRPDLQRLRIQRDINDVDVKFFKNQTKPQVNLQATFATTGLAGTPSCVTNPGGGTGCPTPAPNLIGGYGQNIRNLFGFDTKNISVGLAIQIPFKNKTAEANLAGAKIQREQLEATFRAQEQIAEVDVRNAAQAVETSRQRVLAARDARANAEVQLEGEQRLYAVGRSTTFLLFQRENALANARDQELRAETDYNKALAGLQRATSTTLRAHSVVVDEPTP
jgi:outer membrane protein